MIDRRQFLGTTAAAAAATALPKIALSAEELVAATFGGTWSEVHRKLLAPYFRKRTGAEVVQAVMLATEQIAKLTAAKGALPTTSMHWRTSAAPLTCSITCRR